MIQLQEKERIRQTQELVTLIRDEGIPMVGIMDLKDLKEMPMGVPSVSQGFSDIYRYAVVMGIPLGTPYRKVSGRKASLFLEGVALVVVKHLSKNKNSGLIVHTDDELDPVQRKGLMSLKVLAKMSGLGWQGRSLLIMSPEYGSIHRLIAVLTNMPLSINQSINNLCGDCKICVDACPKDALTWVDFEDHPNDRADVLDIDLCLGDSGCKVCMEACPYVTSKK